MEPHGQRLQRSTIYSIFLAVVLVLGWGQAGLALSDRDRLVCLASRTQALVDLMKSSSEGNATDDDWRMDAVRNAFISFGAECLNVQLNSTQPIRLLVPLIPAYITWKKRATQFEALTGIKVILDVVSMTSITEEIRLELSGSVVHDGFIFDPAGTGTIAAMGGFADLGPFIRDSPPDLQFTDFNRFLRQVSSVYDKTTIGLPMDGDLFLMYYRPDLFTRYNLTVPRTWDDFLDTARKMNGTDTDGDGKPDLLGACFDVYQNGDVQTTSFPQPGGTVLPAAACKGSYLLAATAGSYIQYKGTAHGFWFDPDSIPVLTPLNNNPGMRAALKFWHDITPFTNPVETCNGANLDFQQGRCLLTINWGNEFRASKQSKLRASGMLAVAPLPGSLTVLNRTSNTLVPCDDKICPFAQPYTNPETGQQGWVNTAPFPAFGGWTGGVSNYTSPEQQQKVFQFLTFVTSPKNSWLDLLDSVVLSVDPFREQHLNNVSRWLAAGYGPVRLAAYLQAIKDSLSNPNVMLDTRLAYSGDGYRQPLEEARRNASNPAADDAVYTAIMQALETDYQIKLDGAAVKQTGGRHAALAQQYWNLIGRSGSVTEVLAARRPRTIAVAAAPVPGPSGDSGLTKSSLAAAVAVPVAFLVVVLVVGAFVYLRHTRAQEHRSLFGKVLAPGVGPQTTLVIADVQDSTSLFEVLPMTCMDQVMQLFCSITRTALANHNGYESATEGDSFIIAFHNPQDAGLFCIDLQAALLDAPWPEALLRAPGVESVHPGWVTPTARAIEVVQMLKGQSRSTKRPVGTAWAEDKVAHVRSWHSLMASRYSASAAAARGASSGNDSATVWNALYTGGSFQSRGSSAPLDIPLDLADALDCDRDSNASLPSIPAGPNAMIAKQPFRRSATGQLEGVRNGQPTRSRLSLSGAGGKVSATGHDQDTEEKTAQYSILARPPPMSPAQRKPTVTLLQLLGAAWQPSSSRPRESVSLSGAPEEKGQQGGARLVWAGLRVRCGVVAGMHNEDDMRYNKDLGRVQYCGAFLAAAKRMEAVAHGGQILLSQSAMLQLDRANLPKDVLLLHMGQHIVDSGAGATPTIVAASSGAVLLELEPADEESESGKNGFADQLPVAQPLYAMLHVRTAPRLASLPQLRVRNTLVRGVLSAPLGEVTIGFCHVVGVTELQAWDASEVSTALDMFSVVVKSELLKAHGYLADHVGGFSLAAFHSPAAAMRWAVAVQAGMRNAAWSKRLLSHASAEELVLRRMQADGSSQKVVLFRGPRIKVGLDTGSTKSEVHSTTGRMEYRGKVLNRAARIASSANSGQVLCSVDTWRRACSESKLLGLSCVPLGEAQLKGIKDKIEIYEVNAESHLKVLTPQLAAGPVLARTGPATG